MPARRPARAPELQALYERPGFQLRRAHQIAVGLFVQECAALGLNPPQHSVLQAIACRPAIDQTGLARALGFDRATIGILIRGLEARGLLERRASDADRRRNLLRLTPQGRQVLRRAAPGARRMSERLLAPLTAAERAQFMDLLSRITTQLNPQSRTPLEPPAPDDRPDGDGDRAR
jgi:DNA-binding MarR family transcriptional regulator